MKWRERVEYILIVATVLALLALFASAMDRAHGETCLTTTVQPHQVLGNFDGDTFAISLGALGAASIRVQDIDTPERTKKQPGWEAAKNFTAKWLAAGPFELATCFDLTFGRVVGVASRGGQTLAEALRDAGFDQDHRPDGE